ncbi:MAG TPA: HEAT repeat domain-containing protein [Elusimicrobiales bacterium]|nr:HEAT repeat domain-containing protein [Elusimicrobiales bacterium]
MFALIIYGGLAAWTGWLLRKYKLTGDGKHLKSAGSLVIAASFFLAVQAGYYSVLYPGREWAPYLVLLLGTAAGGMILAAGYKGAWKLSALVQVVLYLVFTGFLVSCLPYFGRTFKVAHAFSECAKVVPGASLKGIAGLGPEKKAELAPRLAEALDSGDRYVRLGALHALAYMPAEAAVALPRLIPLVPETDEDLFRAVMILLGAMGPAAADAAPVLETRLADATQYERPTLEKTLAAVRPTEPPPAP